MKKITSSENSLYTKKALIYVMFLLSFKYFRQKFGKSFCACLGVTMLIWKKYTYLWLMWMCIHKQKITLTTQTFLEVLHFQEFLKVIDWNSNSWICWIDLLDLRMSNHMQKNQRHRLFIPWNISVYKNPATWEQFESILGNNFKKNDCSKYKVCDGKTRIKTTLFKVRSKKF